MRNLKSGFILSYISIFIQSIISILYTPVMLRLLGEVRICVFIHNTKPTMTITQYRF